MPQVRLINRKIWRPSISVLVLALVLVHFLQPPNPVLILMIPVVFAAYADGYPGGILCGAAVMVYSLSFHVGSWSALRHSDLNTRGLLTILIAVAGVIVMVGRLKARDAAHGERMARLNENFLKVLSGMDVQLLVTEPGTDRILFANKKKNQSYGVDYDPSGQPCWRVYHGLNERCPHCPMKQLYANPDKPINWMHRNGRTGRWFHNRESVIEWTDGRMVHLQQGVDITDRRELNGKLLIAKDQAEKSSKAKSEFLARMSHEIRTPMNAIIGMTGIASKTTDPARIHSCLCRIDEASRHLLGIINDILDMSVIEAGEFSLSESDFVLEHMIGRVVNISQSQFDEKRQRLSIAVDPNVPVAIVGDQQRLAQVLVNLLSNAAKFTPDGGRISLGVSCEQDNGDAVTLRFTVRDNGIGMTEEQQSRLFRPFEQAEGGAARRFGGMGLGLAMSKTIVDMMGGSLHVRSTPGEGSAFSFTVHAARGAATRTHGLSPLVDWRSVRLLVLDGMEDACRYFQSITDALGVSCDGVQTVDDALERLREGKYDVVFVDRDLPGGGFAAVQAIRAAFPRQMVVLMVSGMDVDKAAREAESAGVRHSMIKPILPSTVIDSINGCFCERPVEIEPDAPEVDADVGIFLGKRLLLADDVEVNRELLKALLEKTGIETVEAENGEEACRLFAKRPGDFNIILMDIHMPCMDGYTATRTIRGMPDTPEAKTVPIIAVTANTFPEDVQRSLAAGMNGHLGKPIDADEVLAVMKQHVSVERRHTQSFSATSAGTAGSTASGAMERPGKPSRTAAAPS